jgi:hypothetical protein
MRERRNMEVENDLIERSYEVSIKNFEFAAIHLRDARNLSYAIPDLRDNRALSKAAILMAAAALESNLTYLAQIALTFVEARPGKFHRPHINFLRGVEEEIDDNGKLVERRSRQTLVERMSVVPGLLARAIDRKYELPQRSAGAKKMKRTIERRDAIVHPRSDRYLSDAGWWEAAEAIDAVELYLQSVDQCLHPYLMGYSSLLWTIKGPTKGDVGVGYRTFGKRGPGRTITNMQELRLVDVLLAEWLDAFFMTEIAFAHGTEGDSDGSMLTRAALVLLYATVDAQLAIVSQWKMRESPSAFAEAETLFLNEAAVGIGHDGEIFVDSDQQSFKKRVKAIPAVLARCVDRKEFIIDLGQGWGQDFLRGYALRNGVVHSSPGEHIPRVSKEELRSAVAAVRAYFTDLARNARGSFGHMDVLLASDTPIP